VTNVTPTGAELLRKEQKKKDKEVKKQEGQEKGEIAKPGGDRITIVPDGNNAKTLDEIDNEIYNDVYGGYFNSRLRVLGGMWEKGEVIANYTGGKTCSWKELSRETERSDVQIKKWHELYSNNKDKNKYIENIETSLRKDNLSFSHHKEVASLEPEKQTEFLNRAEGCIQKTCLMQALPSNLRFHGFDYTQVCRGGRSCLYRQAYEGKTVGFEVSIIRINPENSFRGKTYPAHERWPKDDDFSKTAWACWNIEEAKEKFNELER